jgi:hypothetical protein
MIDEIPPPWRLPLLVAGFLCVVVGVLAGLARLGWQVPDVAAAAAAVHGPLMISGFLGTVIGLERAVALRHPWSYLGPLLSGAGGIGLAFGIGLDVAPWLLLAGSTVLVAASVQVFLRQRALFTLTLALGAAAWFIGNALWAGGLTLSVVVPWWMAFLVLTIAGERLELSRMLPRSATAQRVFAGIVAVMLVAVGVTLLSARYGHFLFALSLLGVALWLLRQDIARRTVKQTGLPRFIAVCLLSGYGWLSVAAAVGLFSDSVAPGTPGHDAFLHVVLLGFVFSMVLGHAPIIFPAVLRVRIPYHRVFYVPLLALHVSVLTRFAGDALGILQVRSVGALLNALALLLFVATMIGAVWRGRRVGGDEAAGAT